MELYIGCGPHDYFMHTPNDGDCYTAQWLVSIKGYSTIENGKYVRPPEWVNITTEQKVMVTQAGFTFPKIRHSFKPEVLKWLEDNVEPSTDRARSNNPKGYCLELEPEGAHLNVLFLRRRDALKFIKKWSETGKPTTTYDKRHYD